MKRFAVVVADPPWHFSDSLRMSKIKRGAVDHYATMKIDAIVALGADLMPLLADDAVLALWVPSSMLADGLRVVSGWGFNQKTVHTWIKTAGGETGLAFGMGHQLRACSEHALICTRGSPHPIDRSQRNVELHPALPHSAKPDTLQKRLALMYPRARRLELFARRDLPGWTCQGLECPSTLGVDVRAWMEAQR